MTRYVIHNHLPAKRAVDEEDLQRHSGDVIWHTVSEAEYNKITPGTSTVTIDGRPAVVIDKIVVKSQFSGTLYRCKVRFK